MAEQIDEMLDAIAFVGDTLAPFFLEDPKTGGAQASFSVFASLDADAGARVAFCRSCLVRPCPSGND